MKRIRNWVGEKMKLKGNLNNNTDNFNLKVEQDALEQCIAESDEHYTDINFNLKVEQNALKRCIAECDKHFSQLKRKVEVGGLIIGTFDGNDMNVHEFLFDNNAKRTPHSITLSIDIFRIAEEKVDNLNKRMESSKNWHLVGTWHTHPDGFCTYSQKDENMLFRDSMRIITDDPSRAFSPMVHFIFNNFRHDQADRFVFTMRLKSEYSKEKIEIEDMHEKLEDRIKEKIGSDEKTIGLIIKDPNSNKLFLENYHPDYYNMNQKGKIEIQGFWKYYPFETISSDFEQVFLENFFQKIKHETFSYARLLQDEKENDINIEWYKCTRSNKDFDAHRVVYFKDIAVQIDEIEKLTGNDTEDNTSMNIKDINVIKTNKIDSTDISSPCKEELINDLKKFQREIPSLDLSPFVEMSFNMAICEIINEVGKDEPNIEKIKNLYMKEFEHIKDIDKVCENFIGLESTNNISKLLGLDLSLI